nr:Rha family transcriptional regulator [Mycobacterium sp. UM_NZ2]
MSTELVFADNEGELFTTSLVIAEQTGNRHKNVLDLIRTHLADLKEVGRVAFETRVAGQSPNPTTYATLDEPASALLITNLRGCPVVWDFRKRLVAGFYAMRQQLANRPAVVSFDLTSVDDIALLAQATTQAVAMYRQEHEQRLALEAQAEVDRPLVERAKTHAGAVGDKTRQQFFRELKQWAQDAHGITVKQSHVMTFLSTAKLGLFTRGNRMDSGNATSWAIEHGYARNPEGTAHNGHNFIRPVLTPSGQAYAWDRCVRYIDANGTLELPRQIGSGVA